MIRLHNFDEEEYFSEKYRQRSTLKIKYLKHCYFKVK